MQVTSKSEYQYMLDTMWGRMGDIICSESTDEVEYKELMYQHKYECDLMGITPKYDKNNRLVGYINSDGEEIPTDSMLGVKNND